MTVSVKAPTSTTGSIQLNGSDVLTIDSSGNLTAPNNLTVTGTVTQTGGATFNGGISGNVAFDTDTLYVDATNNNVGIGTSSPQGALEIVGGAAAGSGFSQTRSGHPSYAITCGGTNTVYHSIKASGSSNWYNYFEAIDDGTDISALKFATGAGTERMRVDSSGDVLVGTTSTSNVAGVPTHHMFVRSATDAQWTLTLQNSSASGGARGLCVNYSGQSPNNTNMEPMFFSDSVNYRFAWRSNGGIANYSANDVNLSDRREKTNFAPAKSYLQTICSIPVQTFNYIDQNLQEDDGLTLGVVAQDVQAVAPELVTESDWGSDGNPKMRLSVYQTDLTYALMKCIQEQQDIIKALETRIQTLENPNG